MTSGIGRSRSDSGFTLVELVTVLALGALILGAGLIVFGGSDQNQFLKMAASKIEASIEDAAAHALNSGSDQVVVFGAGTVGLEGRDTNTELPESVDLMKRETAKDDWIAFGKEERWFFRAGGIQRPRFLRLVSSDSWIELDFAAVGGVVSERRKYLP